jgi:hypothetical protein
MALFLVCSIALGIMGLHDRRVAPDLGKYRSGLEGERMLPKYLASLDDRFYLINWVRLPGMDGDIDHILVGPPGVGGVGTVKAISTVQVFRRKEMRDVFGNI